MPKWLTKAKAAFKAPEPEPPEPFRLVCVCGEAVSGVRLEREQRVRCPACNHEMFVLPESVYPEPEVRYRPKLETGQEVEVIDERPPKSSDELPPGPADAISLPKETQVRSSPNERKSKRSAQKRRSSSADRAGHQDAVADAIEVEIDDVRGIRDLRVRRSNFFTPFRLIVAGIVAALLLTGYAVVHSRNVANAEVVRTQSGKLGQQALDDGDLAAANEHFTKVEKALQTLGSDDPQSRQLHQLFLEVHAATDLIPDSVPDMISAAVASGNESSITSWEDNFDLTYRDKWIILDTVVSNDGPDVAVRIDVPVLLEKNAAVIVVDGTAIAERVGEGQQQRVIFGGRLASCEATGDAEKTWELRLAADTIFFWANPRTYELTGFPLDDEAIETLRQQADMLGVSE